MEGDGFGPNDLGKEGRGGHDSDRERQSRGCGRWVHRTMVKAPIEPHVLRSSERPSRLKARSQGGLAMKRDRTIEAHEGVSSRGFGALNNQQG
jgi:hypothetical protein